MFEKMCWWHVLIVSAISLSTRILPRLFCPGARGMDTYYHLLAAHRIRNNHFRLPKTIDALLLPGIYDYPPAFHYFLALFPRAWRFEIERWASAVFDAVHGLAVYFFSIYYLVKAHCQLELSFTALLVSLMFLMSPSLTSVGAGPRAYQGTPRTLGELFFTLCVLCTIIHFLDGGLVFLLLAGLFGGMLLLTSKFAAQVLLLFYCVFFLFFRDMTWLAVPVIGLFFAFVFSGGKYKEIALGHWEHCRYYRKAISERFYLVTNKNKWKDLKTVLLDLYRAPKKAAQTLLMDNTYALMLIKNPQLFYIGFLFLTGASVTDRLSTLLLVWIGASLLLFLVTSLRPFLFLGEADRYLEYALFPQFLLICMWGGLFPFVYWVLGYETVLYALFIAIFIYTYSEKARDLPDFEEMVSFIRSEQDIGRILPVYLNDALQLAYESGKGVAHFPGNFRNRFFPFSEFLRFYEKVYPFPNEDLQTLMKRYEYDVVYFSQKDMAKAKQYGLDYDFKDWAVLFSNGKYKVLKPE